MTSNATAGSITGEQILADIEKMRSQIEKVPRGALAAPPNVGRMLELYRRTTGSEALAHLPGAVAGIPYFEHQMTEWQQHRKPRSKKRRIQKKAAKFRAGSPWWREVPDETCFMFDPGAFEVSDIWRVDGAMSPGGVA